MRKKMEIVEMEMKMKTKVFTMKVMKNNREHVPVPSTPSNFIMVARRAPTCMHGMKFAQKANERIQEENDGKWVKMGQAPP